MRGEINDLETLLSGARSQRDSLLIACKEVLHGSQFEMDFHARQILTAAIKSADSE